MEKRIVRIIAVCIAAIVGRLDHENFEMLLADRSANLLKVLEMDQDDLLELLYRLQNDLDITIPDDSFRQIQTVGDLIDAVMAGKPNGKAPNIKEAMRAQFVSAPG